MFSRRAVKPSMEPMTSGDRRGREQRGPPGGWVLSVSAGVGPVEARRFVALLAQRLERRCAEEGLAVEDVVLQGEEAAPRSVELHLRGALSLELRNEAGTHALVARSPGRGRASRKRWFASVTLHEPFECGLQEGKAIDPRELVVTACRAGGSGGQHVNKVSTAVRVLHIPSGVEVRVASERSQKANLRHAVARLGALLAERARERQARAGEARRLTHYQLVRGAAVRTYALGPDGRLVTRGAG